MIISRFLTVKDTVALPDSDYCFLGNLRSADENGPGGPAYWCSNAAQYTNDDGVDASEACCACQGESMTNIMTSSVAAEQPAAKILTSSVAASEEPRGEVLTASTEQPKQFTVSTQPTEPKTMASSLVESMEPVKIMTISVAASEE